MTSPIAELRHALGFKVEEVALMAQWSPDRQREIEAGGELLADEADKLTALLGADVESLETVTSSDRPLRALLKSGAQRLDASTRFTLAEATTVAREVQELRALLGLPTGLGDVGTYTANADYSHPRKGVPERLASVVRRDLELGAGEVRSVTEQILNPLGIVLLWTPLPHEMDALAFASEETGAVIVANPQGSHMGSAFGRRVALAHELCHLLFDRPEMARFVRACDIERGLVGYDRGWFEKIERRARAFAMHLLAPKASLTAIWQASAHAPIAQRVREVMEVFGIGYEAARSHLATAGCLPLRQQIDPVSLRCPPAWGSADPPPQPSLRSGTLAELAEEAVRRERISPRRAAELRRGPLAAPAAWRPEVAAGAYRTSSMATDALDVA